MREYDNYSKVSKGEGVADNTRKIIDGAGCQFNKENTVGNTFYFSLILVLGLLLSSCVFFEKNESNSEEILRSNSQRGNPEWVTNPKLSDAGGLFAVGKAEKGDDSFAEQLKRSEDSGRKQIIKCVEEKFFDILYELLRKTKFDDGENPGLVLEASLKRVIRQFDYHLITRIDVSLDAKDMLFTRMFLKWESLEKYMHKNRNIFDKNLKKAALSDSDRKALKLLVDEFYNKIDGLKNELGN